MLFQLRFLKLSALKYLNRYLWKYRLRLIFGVVTVAISAWFAVFPAQLIRNGIDIIIEGISEYRMAEGFAVQSGIEERVIYEGLIISLLIIATALLRGFFTFLTRQTIIVMSRLIEYDLKNEIFQHYQVLSLAFYKKNRTGDMMTRISEDVSQVRMYIGPAIMYTTNLVMTMLVTLVTMIAVNPTLTLYVLLPLPIMSVSIFYVNSLISRRSGERQQRLSGMSSFVQEAFSGIRVVKAYGRETDFETKFDSQIKDYRRKSMNVEKRDSLFFHLMKII